MQAKREASARATVRWAPHPSGHDDMNLEKFGSIGADQSHRIIRSVNGSACNHGMLDLAVYIGQEASDGGIDRSTR